MEGSIQNSLENLHISGEVDGAAVKEDEQSDVNSSLQTPTKKDITTCDNHQSTNNCQAPILLCDAWYGFPSQKRPRKERINAVSRQLSNFLEWRSSSSSTSDSTMHNCRVSLLGSDGDVKAVKERMDEITNNHTDHKDVDEIDFQSITIQKYIGKQDTDEDVVYLSPDATDTLSCTSPPPRIVIIGMLIDRRITTDRSRKRSETLNIRSARLPLDELNVKELTNREPLNVDTVLELMQRWYYNCDQLKKKNDGSSGKITSDMYRKCFVSAAAYAMKTQRERHPNRTVHITSNE